MRELRSRAGFTLTEMVIVVVILGLVTLMALPKAQAIRTQSALQGARNQVAGLYQRARSVAINQGQVTELRFDGNKVFISAEPRRSAGAGTYDTVGTVQDLGAAYGVTVDDPGSSIRFDIRGLRVSTATDSAIVSKGSHTKAVVFQGYGGMVR